MPMETMDRTRRWDRLSEEEDRHGAGVGAKEEERHGSDENRAMQRRKPIRL